MSKQYRVEAVWDPEVSAYYARSDVPGLNVEADTLEAFIEIVKDLAPELIHDNAPETFRGGYSVRLEAELAHA